MLAFHGEKTAVTSFKLYNFRCVLWGMFDVWTALRINDAFMVSHKFVVAFEMCRCFWLLKWGSERTWIRFFWRDHVENYQIDTKTNISSERLINTSDKEITKRQTSIFATNVACLFDVKMVLKSMKFHLKRRTLCFALQKSCILNTRVAFFVLFKTILVKRQIILENCWRCKKNVKNDLGEYKFSEAK